MAQTTSKKIDTPAHSARNAPQPSLFELLAYRHFLRLWGGSMMSKIAENLLHFFFILHLYNLTKSNAVLSALVVAYSLPPILLSSWSGVIADSYDRRRILLAVDSAKILLLIVSLFITQNPAGIIVSAILLTVIGEFFGPTHNASIPSLVDRSHLFLANTVSTMSNYASFLIGFSIAGPLLYYFGPQTIVLLGLAFMVGALTLHYFLPPIDHHLRELRHPSIHFLQSLFLIKGRLLEGMAFIRQHPLLLLVILQAAFAFTVERSFVSLMPNFSEELLHFTTKDISTYLIVPTGIGAVLGALAANKLKVRISKPVIVNTGIVLDGLGLLLVALYPFVAETLPVIAVIGGFSALALGYIFVLAIVSGIADPMVMITTQTLIHERTPAATRGRVFGGLTTLMNLVGILPILVIGLLANIFSIESVVFGLGVLTLLIALIGGLLYRKLPLTPPLYDASDFISEYQG